MKLIFFRKSGLMYQGGFKYGVKHGKGEEVDKRGNHVQGEWIYGILDKTDNKTEKSD